MKRSQAEDLRLHASINDAAHHETLDELKERTFEHLDGASGGQSWKSLVSIGVTRFTRFCC